MKQHTHRIALVLSLSLLVAATACSSKEEPAASEDQGGSDASTTVDASGSADGGAVSETGSADATPDAPFVCTSTPVGGPQPSGTLSPGFHAPTLATTTTVVNNGFARVQTTKDKSNYYLSTLSLVFTDHVACGYAKADVGKENGVYGEITLHRSKIDVAPAPFTAGTYSSSFPPGEDAGAPPGAIPEQIFVHQPLKFTKEACPGNRVVSFGNGYVTIEEINDTHVKGEASFGRVAGKFDLPICNFPSGDLTPTCGCVP